MNTIIAIILTLLAIILTIVGIYFMRHGYPIGALGIYLIVISIIIIFYLGSTFVGSGIFTKETICTYTVGKSNEICIDNYKINYYYQCSTISDKIGLSYFIVDILLILVLIREFIIMFIHMGDCIPHYGNL